jgi:hypothetical protein
MVQVGNVPEINAVKKNLDEMMQRGVIKAWELPYEQILTRLTAAIFFLTPADASNMDNIWKELSQFPRLNYRLNEEKKLSLLEWRLEFNKDFSL